MFKRLFFVFLLVLTLLSGLLWPALWPTGAARAAGEDGSRDVITPTTMLAAGVTQSLSAASGDGHKFVNNGREFLVARNSTAGTITMTVVTGGTVDGYAINDVDIAIAAGATALAGPFKPEVFNQRSGSDAGKVYLNWNSTVTGTVANSVTVNVYKLP